MSFVFPTWAPEDEMPPLAPGARGAQVTSDVDPFVEGDVNRIVGVDVPRQAID